MNKPTPTVYGIGYTGSGEYKVRINGKLTPEYQAWSGMIGRCYSESKLSADPSYRGCTVHEEWLNFQMFAEWYTNQESYGKGYHLDKDVLKQGNKLYSAETCCLIPSEVNIGVKHLKGFGVTKRPNGDFQVRVNIFGKRVSLGSFKCIEQAREAYLEHKIKYKKLIAEKYKNEISAKVYIALTNNNGI